MCFKNSIYFVTYYIKYFIQLAMRPSSKKKGNFYNKSGQAVLKVNVPAFKFEKAKEYNQMYEEAFEHS